MLKRTVLIVAGIAAIAATFPAGAAETDAAVRLSPTAQEGFLKEENGYSRVDLVPHVMRQTDTKMVSTSVPGPGAVKDQNRYQQMVETPHRMPGASGHVVSAEPGPGLFLEDGAYHGVR